MAGPPHCCALVVVNGMQLMQCALPTASEGICQVEAPAHENLRVTDDFGRVELSCVFYASSDITGEHRPWVASLSADEEEIELGQVPHAGGRTRIVSRYVREHPQTLKFSVTYRDSSSFTHPEEEQLVQEVRLMMLNDDIRFVDRPAGFVRLSHLRSKLEGLELYKRVVGSGNISGYYQRNFQAFVSSHPAVLRTQQSAGSEFLVGLAADADTEAALMNVSERREREAAALAAVRHLLDDGPLEIGQLLNRMRDSATARGLFRPSSRALVGFLERHCCDFWVRSDPVHTTLVGLRFDPEDKDDE